MRLLPLDLRSPVARQLTAPVPCVLILLVGSGCLAHTPQRFQMPLQMPLQDAAALPRGAGGVTQTQRSATLSDELADWFSGHSTAPASMPLAKAASVESRTAPGAFPAMAPGAAGDSVALDRRVSVEAVDVPLDSLLFALARDADLALDIGPGLTAEVTLRSVDSPLSTVLAQLARQVPLNWRVMDNTLEVAGPWQSRTSSYRVNYLNIDRSTSSSVGLATRVGTINAMPGASATGNANNSETRVENHSEHRFWQSLSADIEQLLDQPDEPAGSAYSINRDAGLLTLTATGRTHRVVSEYLALVNTRVQRQVLIEATVVEVALSERHESGIDWRLLASSDEGFSAAQVLAGAPFVNTGSIDRLGAPNTLVSYVKSSGSGDVGATLTLLEQFGDVRILSRPRIIALNNQSSVLKVVDNRVYFTVNVERQRSDETDEIITETEIHTVPVGLVMNVTPFIGPENDVMLNVRPTLSRILGFVDDPNPELVAARVQNAVPEIQVREMESMLRVASGDLAIIGGLMQETVDDEERRVPGLARLPILGRLFSARRKQRQQTELMIVLRPTVMPADTAFAGSTAAWH